MNYQSLDEAYAANGAARTKLKETVSALSEAQLSALPEGEKWSISQIVEHVAMVNDGVVRICGRLLAKAEAAERPSAGFSVSNDFVEKGAGIAGVKLEAPEIVHPVSGASVKDSLAKLDECSSALELLREKFERFDGTDPKFPHPYFGDLSAQEWFVLSGAHEGRHIRQIRRILEKIG
jgi:hypothetical protein